MVWPVVALFLATMFGNLTLLAAIAAGRCRRGGFLMLESVLLCIALGVAIGVPVFETGFKDGSVLLALFLVGASIPGAYLLRLLEYGIFCADPRLYVQRSLWIGKGSVRRLNGDPID